METPFLLADFIVSGKEPQDKIEQSHLYLYPISMT